jgi:hypothetical protein
VVVLKQSGEADVSESRKMTREQLEAEVVRLGNLATDRLYMMNAYYAMLGPKALEVVTKWAKKGVTRVHTDWAPSAAALTGEGRAQELLDWDSADIEGAPV